MNDSCFLGFRNVCFGVVVIDSFILGIGFFSLNQYWADKMEILKTTEKNSLRIKIQVNKVFSDASLSIIKIINSLLDHEQHNK